MPSHQGLTNFVDSYLNINLYELCDVKTSQARWLLSRSLMGYVISVKGLRGVENDGKWGYIDKSDKLVIEIEPGTLKFPDWQSVMKYLQSK